MERIESLIFFFYSTQVASAILNTLTLHSILDIYSASKSSILLSFEINVLFNLFSEFLISIFIFCILIHALCFFITSS